MNKNAIFLSIVVVAVLLSTGEAFAQRYYIDYSEYNRWLCNNVRGAEKACWDSGKYGDFPSFSACESVRRNNLSHDVRFQRMSRCVPYGSSSEGRIQRQEQESYQDNIRQEQERKELIEKLKARTQSAMQQRETLQKHEEEEWHKRQYIEMGKVIDIYNAMHRIRPPVYSTNPERYNRSLQQAYCSAVQSIKAAEMALNGKFDVSRNLMTDIESARKASGSGFDNKTVSGCSQNISFKIPEVKMSIEDDKRYVQFNSAVTTIQTLLPKIESNYVETSEIEQRIEKLIDILENSQKKERIKKEGDERDNLKRNNEEFGQLTKEAMTAYEKAEKEYLELIKREDELIKERKDIEDKLNELKTAVNNTIKAENK